MKSEEDFIEERFEELFSEEFIKSMREDYEDGKIPIEDKREAIKMKQDDEYSLMLLVRHSNFIDYIEEHNLSEETRKDVEEIRKKLEFNKRTRELEYGRDWEEIEQMVVAGEFEELKEEKE